MPLYAVSAPGLLGSSREDGVEPVHGDLVWVEMTLTLWRAEATASMTSERVNGDEVHDVG